MEIKLQIPTNIAQSIEKLIENGWYLDANELFLTALRNFLRTHSEDLMTDFIREDIEWGLNGQD